MNLKTRLSKLEQHRPKLIYPQFSDMPVTATREKRIQWMLEHNPTATREHIESLNIKSFSDMYDE